MKISSFDLNLFVILNAIYTEGSLTKAAEVVGITQPAVSNALSRLREKFDDDLFVRTGTGMVPTQKTENIISDIQILYGSSTFHGRFFLPYLSYQSRMLSEILDSIFRKVI